MKILDIPQSGKQGLSVSMGGRFGQVRRALVIPTNPRTAAQKGVRQVFSSVTKAWRTLACSLDLTMAGIFVRSRQQS